MSRLDELWEMSLFAVETARSKGAEYADARGEAHSVEAIMYADGEIQNLNASVKAGLGLRVLVKGAWGFYSTPNLEREEVRKAVDRAVGAASSSSRHIKTLVKLAPVKAEKARYATPTKQNLEEIPLERKTSDLLEWGKELEATPRIFRRTLKYSGLRIGKVYANSDGAEILFERSTLWVVVKAEAKEGGLTEMYHRIVGGAGGYERLSEADMGVVCKDVGVKADRLLEAKPAKPVRGATVVFDPSYVSLLVHEILGHPSEADRVLGREAAWAGTTWWEGRLNRRVGSKALTVYDDPTLPGNAAHYLYDDEGVRASRRVLVERGVLRGHIQSRETAALLGVEPNGGMRAITYEYIPLIRMGCTYIAPGNWSREEMISETRRGYLVSNSYEPSIDDRRYNWTISATEAYEIKNGRLGGHLRDVAAAAISPRFFRSIDAVSKEYEISVIPNCGKGDPMQILYVANGGPHLRGVADIVARG